VGLAFCGCLAACGSPGPAPVSPGQVAASTTEVSFDVDGTTTYGTLQVPAHRTGQHLAAALLLAGSGPTDRNGDQLPDHTPNTLKQIAEALAQQGIISLRFDKYFAGKTGAGRFASDPGSSDLNAFLQQADDAYKLLYQQPATDRQRLLAVGHSEGGMYAILVAETVSPHPAGLALVEPQDERLLDLLTLQINESLDTRVTQGAITADTARRNAQLVRQEVAAFRAGQPVDLSPDLLPDITSLLNSVIVSPANARYNRTADLIDVPAYAAKLPTGTRVLVTVGTADTNVPPSTIQPLVDALTGAGTTGPGLQTLTGLDHDLNTAGTPANGAPVDPAFLTALRDWARPYTTAP
jgi:alpha-beta hydrolase superfamily lysophospholipase